MRKFIVAIVLFLGVIFIFTNLAELEAIVAVLQQGELPFLLLGIFVILLWIVNLAAQLKAVYYALGIQARLAHLLPMVMTAFFIGAVAPSAGMSGMVVFFDDARRRNYPPGRATVAGALFILFDYLGFLCFLTIGLVILFRRNTLNAAQIVASVVMFSVALGIATLLYLGTRSAKSMGRALAWLARLVNALLRPFLKRDYLSQDRAHAFARDAAEGLAELRHNRHNLLLPLALGLSNKALMLAVLYLSFLTFQVPVAPDTIFAGYAVAYLFLVVSPTPAGLGFVEGALALSLKALGVALSAATVITLTYRAITFWVPLFLGMLASRSLGAPQDVPSPEDRPAGGAQSASK